MTSAPEAPASGLSPDLVGRPNASRGTGEQSEGRVWEVSGVSVVVAEGGRLTVMEMFWAGAALIVPLLFVNAFALPAWTPRYLALPLLAGVGLTCLPGLARRSSGAVHTTAALGLAFGAWAVIATCVAPNSTVALWGRYPLGTGLIFVVALVGTWAGGASVRPRARNQIERALLAACVVNATVAVAQRLFNLSGYGLATYGGRATGLYGNPVYLAGLLAGGLWLALCRLDGRGWTGAAAVVLIAAAVDLTGSRFGLILAVVAALLIARRLGWRRASAGAALIALGLVAGASIASVTTGKGATGVERAGEAPASGLRPRVDTWYSAIGAITERPLVGWGPSGFLAATSARRSLATARAEGPDMLFADAHNLMVEYAVTTGIPGVALLGAWLLSCVADAKRSGRNSSGSRCRLHPLAGFGLFILAMSLVEPLHAGVTPLAFLALGAAGVDAARSLRSPAVGARASAGSGPRCPDRLIWFSLPAAATRGRASILLAKSMSVVVIGISLTTTAVFGAGLVALRKADLSGDPSRAVRAGAWLPAWAEPPSVAAKLYGFRSVTTKDPVSTLEARRWWAEAARRDPDDAGRWIDLGRALGSAGDLAGAHAAFIHALDRNPWSRNALSGMIRVEVDQGRPDLAQNYRERLAHLRRP